MLVLGGRLPSLTAARALAAAGYRVVAGDGAEYSTVRYSRFCQELWRHPSAGDSERFAAALTTFLARRTEVGTILPAGERSMAAVTMIRDRLPSRVTIAAPDARLVAACTDKDSLYRIARATDVLHAAVRSVRDLPGLAVAADELGYPCIIKPAVWAAPMPGGSKAIICPDRASLERQLVRWPSGHSVLLVQRYVSGPRHNLHFIAQGGRITASVQSRSVRSDRPDGTGVSVEAISVARDPRLIGSCEVLLGRLAYTGTGLAQFIIPDGSEPYFLEIKPFLGSSYAFAEACGLHQTVAAIDLATQPGRRRRDPDFRYPIGRRYAWTSRDLYGMIAAHSRGEIGRRSTLRWLARALLTAVGADVHATWWWRDPLPTVAVYFHLATLLPWPGRRRSR